MKSIYFYCLLLLTLFISNEIYALEENDAEFLALKKLSINGVTEEIRTAARDTLETTQIEQSISEDVGQSGPRESEKGSIKHLIEAAKNVPIQYQSNAFLCISDYNLCNSNNANNANGKKICVMAITICFAGSLIN